MNVETGEIRRMTEADLFKANDEAGRELWTRIDEEMARQTEARSEKFAEMPFYKEDASSRANDRAATRKLNGKSNFAQRLASLR